MSMPLVSVVVPVYNARDYVVETLESLLAQDYPSLEIIVIDDGSNDGSWELIQAYEDRCRIYRQANVGQSETLNRGWAQARGSLVGYLSADDTLTPGAISALVAALQAAPWAVLVYPDYWLMDEQSRTFREVVAADFDYADVLLNGNCPPGPGMLFRKAALERSGGWNSQLRQIPDYDFLLRLGLCGEGVHLPQRLASFRVHSASQTFAIADEARVAEHGRVIRDYFSRDDIDPRWRRFRGRAQANAAVLMARAHLRAWRIRQALACCRDAFGGHPAVVLRRRTWRLLLNGLLGRLLHRWRTRHLERQV